MEPNKTKKKEETKSTEMNDSVDELEGLCRACVDGKVRKVYFIIASLFLLKLITVRSYEKYVYIYFLTSMEDSWRVPDPGRAEDS
jgi:hypothetical protein